MKKLTVGSCFSGIGGLELGLEWTGRFETKWQIEFDPYASAVLAKHWPNVKRYSDIRDVVRPEPVDLVCGGFPCQDVSLAGKRAGLEGKRSTLWSEMFRLVCEIRPRWVLAENVPGLLSSDDGQFFGNILRDLASAGYDAEWGMLSAAGVGAPHLRRRIFIVAYTSKREDRRIFKRGIQPDIRTGGQMAYPQGIRSRTSGEKIAESFGSKRIERSRTEICDAPIERLPNWSGGTMEQPSPLTEFERLCGREIERDFRGVAYGVRNRVDRLKCLGNAVVPQVAQRIGEMILRKEFDFRKTIE